MFFFFFFSFLTFAGTGLVGLRQKELIQWYVDQQNEKQKYSSQEEVKLEIKKLRAIIEVRSRAS